MTQNSLLSRFIQDKSGQYAVIFAIILIPLLAGVGLAIDYAGAVQNHTRLRDATDAAAFYAAIEYRKNGKLPSNDEVMKFVSGNYRVSGDEQQARIKSIDIVDGQVVLKTEVDRPLAIMGLLGNSATRIGAASIVNVGKDEDLEIALVLDTTYSMGADSGASTTDLDPTSGYFSTFNPNITRIDALKFSATRFVDSVFGNDAGKSRVRIAMVPFAQYVNVGTDKRGASWLSVPDDQASTGTKCYKYFALGAQIECHPVTYTADGATFNSSACTYEKGPEKEDCYSTGGTVWNGCVGSRNEPFNLKDVSPTTKFTGLMDVWCSARIQPLTSDKSELLSTISSLWPSNATYIPEGVMWGARVLSSAEPYTEVKVAKGTKGVRKIMVLMTDGDNQAAADIPAAPTHHSITEPSATHPGTPNYYAERAKTDDWTLRACTEAKKNDIEIYTISFGTDLSASAKAIVKSCATDAKHYFDAKNATALNAAFQAIAAKISGMFLAG